jgi:predicted PurR-regulated permease PerM
VALKLKMGPGTINTILNTAPIIIQGASKLIDIIKDRGKDEEDINKDIPESLDGLKQEIKRVQQRLDDNDHSDVEQIKLIEELAKQNESLAESLKKTVLHLNFLTAIALLAIVIAVISIVLSSIA